MKNFESLIYEDFLAEGLGFLRPSPHAEHDEVSHQLDAHSAHPFIPDWAHAKMESLRHPDKFAHALRGGRIERIHPGEVGSIHNASSWDQVDREKRKRVQAKVEGGDKLDMPIVLHHRASGEKYLLAGNSRLAYHSGVKKRPTPVVHIDV